MRQRTVNLVGPKGYEHGWIFKGIPGVTPHNELLRMRKEARAAHPQGHPERLKAEKAVRHSRKILNEKPDTNKMKAELERRAKEQRPGVGAQPDLGPQPDFRAEALAAARRARQAQAAQDKAAGRGGTTILNPQNFGQVPSSAPGKSLGRGGDTMPVTPGEGPRHSARGGSGDFTGKRVELMVNGKRETGIVRQHTHSGGGTRRYDRLTIERDGHPGSRIHRDASTVRLARAAGLARGPRTGGFQPGDRVATDTGVTGTVHSVQGHRVRVKSASYIRGYQHINASRLRKLSQSRAAVELSVDTPRLVATPAPRGKPGGPGLYRLKGAKLPNYIENMRNALMRGGMSEGRATATAISRCKVLAVTSKHPEVKAAAAAAIAELKATAARAKASHGHANEPRQVVELFNMFHAPPGAGGGQFTTAAGASGGAKAPPKSAGPSGYKAVASKQAILKQVKGLRQRIHTQTVTLAGLKAQRHSLVASVSGGSKATGTTRKAAKKAGAIKKSKTTVKQKAGAKKKATVKSTGAAKASSRAATMGQIARLGTRISALSHSIATERGQVRTLLAKARGM